MPSLTINKRGDSKEDPDQNQLTYTILIEKLNSSFFHVKPFDGQW